MRSPLIRVYGGLWLGVELTLRCVLYTYFVIVYVLVELPRSKSAAGCRVHFGSSQPTGLWCIFAVAQKRRVSANLIAFLDCLKGAGYNVILVNNGNLAPGLTSSLLPYCHSVVERPRGGRDFGGWKWGTNALPEMSENCGITRVIYCNDSIFIRPSRLKLLLDRIRQMNDDYIGITDAFDPSYHVQSWFFIASGQLFRSPEFQRFWQKYSSLSYRPHCIKKGEIGICAFLSKYGYHPRALYTQRQIVDLIGEGTIAEAVVRTIFGLNPDDYRDVATKMQGIAFSSGSHSDIALLDSLKRAIMEKISLSNTINSTNLILLKHTTFPFLKKDLVYRGNYLLSQIEIAIADWAGEDADYLPEIFAYFRARGTLRGQISPGAMLARIGLV